MATQSVMPQAAGGVDPHFMNDVGRGKATTWVKHRENLTTRPTWQQLFNYGAECCHWIAKTDKKRVRFTKSSTCLVATLCCDRWDVNTNQPRWDIFHSTIPRLEYFDHLLDKGHLRAPIWHAAAKKQRKEKREVHAEDNALHGFESTHRTYHHPGQEQLRMLAVSITDHPAAVVKRHDICGDCKAIGNSEPLNIRFLLEGNASDLDRQDAQQQLVQNLQQQKQRLYDQRRQQQSQQEQPRPGTSGSGNSGSTEYGYDSDFLNEVIRKNGLLNNPVPTTSGNSPTKGGQSPRGGGTPAADPVDRLARGMSGLSVGPRGPVPFRGPPRGTTTSKPTAQAAAKNLPQKSAGPARKTALPQPPPPSRKVSTQPPIKKNTG